MIERNLNGGKLKISKRLVALMLAGACSFTLVGCKANNKGKVRVGTIEKNGNDTSFVDGACIQIRDENNHLIEEWLSIDDYHTVANLVDGDYTARLLYTPEGYYYADPYWNDIEFEVKSNSRDITIDFELKKSPIRETTFDESNYNYLSVSYEFYGDSIGFWKNGDVELQIVDLNNKIVDNWTSHGAEMHPLIDLIPGTYIVRVIGAPEGYNVEESEKVINITDKKQTSYVMFSFVENNKIVTNNSNNHQAPTKKLNIR